MKYYKNHEVAKLFKVSQSAVGKWIEATRNGKLALELAHEGDRHYIAATTKNRFAIAAIVENRKKYYNQRSHKLLCPKPEFYQIFDSAQILDIVNNLEKYAEIPLQYNYFGDGAKRWDKHVKNRITNDKHEYVQLKEARHLNINLSYVDQLLAKYNKVNIIDVCPGNGYPIKEFLSHLLSKNKMGRYMAVDISADMLELLNNNISTWFNGQIEFECDIKDISFERFTEDIAEVSSPDSGNLVMFLGSMLGNFNSQEEVLSAIRNSMGKDDLLIYTAKLDKPHNRTIFDFKHNNVNANLNHYVMDLLNIDPSLYEVEYSFDAESSRRYSHVKFNVAVTVEIDIVGSKKRIEFHKDDTITTWYYIHQTADQIIKQFSDCGFNILMSSQIDDHELLLIICDLKVFRK